METQNYTKKAIKNFIIITIFILLLLSMFKPWLPQYPNLRAIENVIKVKVLDVNPIIKQFESLYPGFRLTYYSESSSAQNKYHQVAQISTSFCQRYILVLKAYFNISNDGKDVIEIGTVRIELKEVEKSSFDDNGGVNVTLATKKILTVNDWKNVVNAKGDISIIIPDFKKDQPIPNFDLWDQWSIPTESDAGVNDMPVLGK